MTSRVFVVQRIRHVSYRSGELEEKYDLAPAKRFGEIHYLLDSMSGRPTAPSFHFDVGRIYEALNDANLTAQDYLLPIGAPTLIGVATAIFADLLGGKVRMLQWDHRKSDYLLQEACVFCTKLDCIGHDFGNDD